VVNEGGVGRLYLMDTATETVSPVDSVPMAQISGLQFDPSGRRLGMTLNGPRMNGDVYVLDTTSRDLQRWTESDTAGLDTTRFVEPELIHYPTFDRVDGGPRMIPAFYYRPGGGDGGPHPVVISIHGGPEGQAKPNFNPQFNYFLDELGVAVLEPNVRGSSGYGKSYLKLDNAQKREDSVRDIGALLDWIETRPELDSDRVAVLGGSYGGYMVLASMFHFNDRLACGVDVVGISNFVTFLKSTKPYRRDLRRAEYGDEREIGEFLDSISPTTNAHRITIPLFVIQGKNDPRVPWTESQQIMETVRKNGGPVWYLMATNEGHGFSKKDNSDFMWVAIVKFFQEFLL
jgi:dipeptidyl aminopeptidase/acylaminoacyl peptidase